ncbi:MAG: phosphotransferase [Candidatus Riflebacteria bacterium]|nr:phosphotransferase [Candidatus Riflebacteria bacterium]
MSDEKTTWTRFTPLSPLDVDTATLLLRDVVPHHRPLRLESLKGGLRNSNYRVQVEGLADEFVIRLHDHDSGSCRKEFEVLQLVAGSVPVPEVVVASTESSELLDRPYLVLRYVHGILFRDLRRSGDREAIAQAARSAGSTLAAIGRFTFSSPGWFGPDLTIGGRYVEGPDSFLRFLERCLSSPALRARMEDALASRVTAHARIWNDRLGGTEIDSQLVHADFNSSNLIVHQLRGRWAVAAVLDWEFAFSGTPLHDLGNFIRYERVDRPLVEPHFSEGYVSDGGKLPPDWWKLARAVDLTALCEILTRPGTPGSVTAEVLELVEATIEERDPG